MFSLTCKIDLQKEMDKSSPETSCADLTEHLARIPGGVVHYQQGICTDEGIQRKAITKYIIDSEGIKNLN